jgi:hypothetical protein
MGSSGSVIEAGDRRFELFEEIVDLVFVVAPLADLRFTECGVSDVLGGQAKDAHGV